jgi:hypothetical protein
MESRWGARGEGVPKGQVAQPQLWREPQHHDEQCERQEGEPLGEVCDRVADGAADMGNGGGAEDFGGMHSWVDRLDEQEDDSRAAEESTEQEMMPMRVHRP